MTLNKLIHLTDFSENADHALKLAGTIARKAGSKVMLAHVYVKPYLTTARSGGLTVQLDKEADKAIHDAIYKGIEQIATSEAMKGIPMSRRLFNDIPVWKITEELGEDSDAGLIVVGASGEHTLIHGGVLGTNTERLMRRSPLPVLIVPQESEVDAIEDILFITDFKYDLSEFFPFVVKLADLFQANIKVAHINTSGNFASTAFAEEKFADLKSQHPYEKLSLIVHNDEDIVDAVKHIVNETHIDLLAMPTQGRRGLSSLFYGSAAEELAGSLKIPMLSMRVNK